MTTAPPQSRIHVLVLPPDFLKKKTCEVQAFLKAVQLRRRDQGSYGPWDMLMGSDVRVGELAPPPLTPAEPTCPRVHR